MSDLTFIEKREFERVLDMSSGYVLDFSNRTFEEFILDTTGRKIYDARYNSASGSKAHRLRAFWRIEANALVGKLMNAMVDYSGTTGAQEEICRRIVARLLSDPGVQPQTTFTTEPLLRARLAQLREELSHLALEPDRTKAGLAFEPFINQLFEVFQLRPRQPFRVIGEQIDGSFELDNQIYLLELKWERDPLPQAPLLVFKSKIEAKSTFTRGVFIALNDISDPAKDAITRGKAPSFFAMNGHDLMMVLNEAISLPDYLRKRVRLLAEEGRVWMPFSELG